ncbi:MAG: ABC transporter ATP-binding protein [delta proteobacterium ML8_F1]|nr:MAG: ABC transporter ATP-binding protein [delta proteobacterium ML8_F1]
MFQLNHVIYKNILKIDSLSIKRQEITCIKGESGSGKTTLLRLLNRMITPDGGQILFEGTPLQDINPVALRRRVIMLSQEPGVFPGNIRENLLMGLRFSEKPLATEPELEKILQLVQLKMTLDNPTANLSLGERQRVALGRVLLMNPQVLLLDEPSSALDETTEHLMIKSLVDFTRKGGKTLVMVTHSKKVIENFQMRVIQLKKNQTLSDKEVPR